MLKPAEWYLSRNRVGDRVAVFDTSGKGLTLVLEPPDTGQFECFLYLTHSHTSIGDSDEVWLSIETYKTRKTLGTVAKRVFAQSSK